MVKSDIRKSREKTVTTNLSIGWIDATGIAGGVVETGAAIYVVPRKAEASFQRMLWTYNLGQDPGNFEVVYGIIAHEADDAILDISLVALIQRMLISAVQNWRAITAAGVVNTAKTIEVDMKQMVISRRSDLQEESEYTIAPVYRSGSSITVGSSGILWVKETLFQSIFRDDPEEWRGYTFEESAS